MITNENPVLVYTVPNCPYCLRAKGYFTDSGVPFREIDVIANNKEFAREMIEKSGQKTVPVVDIGGRIVVGFQPHVYKEALNDGMKG